MMPHLDESLSPLRIDTDAIEPRLLGEARRIWIGRVKSEYRSIQLMTQLLSEVLAVGADHATRCVLAEMVADEVRHVALCAAVCQALGATPPAAAEVAAPLPPLDAVVATERVLASAISMFLVNECFSVAYISDLAARCRHPVLAPVIRQIGGDEDEHEAFAEGFVAQRLALESDERRGGWRIFAAKLVDKRLAMARLALREVPPDKRLLADYPEQPLADLGLTSPVRMALLTVRTWEDTLRPRFVRLGLVEG